MATLSGERIGAILEPYYPAVAPALLNQLSVYLDLLVKWNARTNLSSIREPEEMVRRHFGESLFASRHLPACKTLLDLGSGAGFPGLPIALASPEIAVTLAESQNKKSSFLREVVRTLGVRVEVFGGRVETLPADRLFDVVALRAVDHPELALNLARERLAPGGSIVHLRTRADNLTGETFPIPNSADGIVRVWA
jgi:16S rRNA (guanine527-N7)-methyltransferase